ncbi:MAG: hypothetical protein WBN68_08235 [Sedimenticolaceae bacterium]
MNVTPALPNPSQRPVDRGSTAVGAVRPTQQTRDPTDEAYRRAILAQPNDRAERERPSQDIAVPVPRQAGSARIDRALATYAEVGGESDRHALRELLGFDAYA